jgi:hypothetical protein
MVELVGETVFFPQDDSVRVIYLDAVRRERRDREIVAERFARLGERYAGSDVDGAGRAAQRRIAIIIFSGTGKRRRTGLYTLRAFGPSGFRFAQVIPLRPIHSHAVAPAQFVFPGLCSAKPLSGLVNRHKPP